MPSASRRPWRRTWPVAAISAVRRPRSATASWRWSETIDRLRLLIPALLTLAVGGAGIACIRTWRADLPDPVATHWSGRTPDGFDSVDGVVTILAVVTGLGVAVCLITLIRAVPSLAQRLTAGIACWTAVFVVVLMTPVIGAQRGLVDAAEAPLRFWVILPALVAASLAAGAAGWAVPSRPSGRVHDPIGEVPTAAEVPVPPVDWHGRGVRLRLDRETVEFRGLGGLIRIRIPLEKVVRAEVVRVDPFADFGGWGYRIGAFGRFRGVKGFVGRRGEAVLVVHTDAGGPGSQAREIAVVDDARAAAGAINALRAHR
ncbi:MAG: hypothetical protein QM809_09930 [Gordonia sp. (in: high G+C Gram-positive bacteria)]|uniref:hypothetical protein n=1 Tax=Gordonia sp. (in: high G+C Gram-positive bacteria) TaxID=84139 RepID=UPI0039E3FCAD